MSLRDNGGTAEEKKQRKVAYQKAWRATNYERQLELNRQSRKRHRVRDRPLCNAEQKARRAAGLVRKWKYGITPGEWEEMKLRGCGICGGANDLVVDHCHKTGKVRGALCRVHNSGLGKLGDDPHMLRAAIRWVGGEVGWQP